MKPYLERYLRERDLQGFREVLASLTAPQPGDCRRVVYRCVEVLIPAMRDRFPTLTEVEMMRLALERVAELDMPADLDELDARRLSSPSARPSAAAPPPATGAPPAR